MATRRESIFSQDIGLFASKSSNLTCLKTANFNKFYPEIADFTELCETLESTGIHVPKLEGHLTAAAFLNDYIFNPQLLNIALPQLITMPCDLNVNENQDALSVDDKLIGFSTLTQTINCYIDLIQDVLNNQLAQKPYEQDCDQENVTEREHALQAGQISAQLQLPLDDILALLLHDIARPSVNNPEHGHKNHCVEGSKILAPLGLSTDYAALHAYAKFLLFKHCPPYQQLISPTSRYTLAIQEKNFQTEAELLNRVNPQHLASVIYKIMFMRLIDDMSKVPSSELTLNQPYYFDHALINTLLRKQMINYLEHLQMTSKHLAETMEQLKAQLHEAILLLLRAKDYTNSPDFYVNYQDVLNDIEDKSGRLNMRS